MRRLPLVSLLAAVLLGTVLVTAALAAPSAIFTASSTGQRAFVDPIVFPGQRSVHEHCFYGAVGVADTETSTSLRAKPTTWANQANHTAIWIPCVYEAGQLLPPATSKHLLAYYKPVAGTEQVPPENMKGVSHEYGYRCGTGGGTFFADPPSTCSAGILVVTLFWRGVRDFGVATFPTVQAYIRLNVGTGAVGNISLGGPVTGVDGAAGPRTMHGDYFFAWTRDAFQRFLDQCVIPGRACGTNPNV